MTDSRQTEVITEALVVIDRGLGTVQSRELISASDLQPSHDLGVESGAHDESSPFQPVRRS